MELRDALDYDPDTGVLTWRLRPGRGRGVTSFNKQFVGKPAIACLDRHNGYLMGTFNGKRVTAHRVIYQLMTGEEANQVDHINGVKTDNRWANLRNVSSLENSRNARRRRADHDLPAGVLRSGSYFQVQIGVKGGARYHGSFRTLEDAAAKAKSVYEELGFSPDHGKHQPD